MDSQIARKLIPGSLMLSLLGAVASAASADQRKGEVTKGERQRFIQTAILHFGQEIPSPEELRAGHPHHGGYKNGGLVHCVASPASLSGSNPKFNCYLASSDNRSYLHPDGSLKVLEVNGREVVSGDFYDRDGHLHSNLLLDRDSGKFLDPAGVVRTDIEPREMKVKYNDENTIEYQPRWTDDELRFEITRNLKPPFRKARDPYTEVAATRLFWALGYPVDRSDSTEAVICYGCGGGNLVAIDAMIDNYFPGVRIFAEGYDEEQGWSTAEIRSGPYRSWSVEQRKYFDGLVILATLIHHKSNRQRQNNLVCGRWQDGRCAVRATMLIHDLGSVFGSPHAKGRIEAWKKSEVWAKRDDPEDCSVGLKWRDGGGHIEVSNAGREFVIEKFDALTDEHLSAIFGGASFQRVDGQLRLQRYEAIFAEAMWRDATSEINGYLHRVFTKSSDDAKQAQIYRVLAKLEAKLTPKQREQLDKAVIDSWILVLRSKVKELRHKRCRI